jgi:hypothetical protein
VLTLEATELSYVLTLGRRLPAAELEVQHVWMTLKISPYLYMLSFVQCPNVQD